MGRSAVTGTTVAGVAEDRAISLLPEGPVVDEGLITFSLEDPDGRYSAVGLMQEIFRPREWTPFERVTGGWRLAIPRPDVGRMEYQLKGVFRGGDDDEVFCDPANPQRAPGAFGDKSVLELPGYRRPSWLDGPRPRATQLLRLPLPVRALRTELSATLWSCADAEEHEPLPLLIAHDGTEYAELSGLLQFLETMQAQRRLPRMRAVLIDPIDRNETYSASARYSRTLATEVLPALEWLAPTGNDPRLRVGMGASLGALAMLHLHRTRPSALGGLYLQSGSYFRQRYDKQESGFPRFRRISRFVGDVLNGPGADLPAPVTLTCGTVEENLANNTAVAAALQRQGYDVRMEQNRDAHNYVAWRDTFDPHLIDLLNLAWAAEGCASG